MPEHERQLIGLLNEWQDKNDLRPSEMVTSLLRMAAYYAPTAKKDALQALLDGWDKATSKP